MKKYNDNLKNYTSKMIKKFKGKEYILVKDLELTINDLIDENSKLKLDLLYTEDLLDHSKNRQPVTESELKQMLADESGRCTTLELENKELKETINILNLSIEEIPKKLKSHQSPIFELGQKFAHECYLKLEENTKELDFYKLKIKEITEYNQNE